MKLFSKASLLGFLTLSLALNSCTPDSIPPILGTEGHLKAKEEFDLTGAPLADCAGKAFLFTDGALELKADIKIKENKVDIKLDIDGKHMRLVDLIGTEYKASQKVSLDLKAKNWDDPNASFEAKFKVKFKLSSPGVEPVYIKYDLKVVIKPSKEVMLIKEKGELENESCLVLPLT